MTWRRTKVRPICLPQLPMIPGERLPGANLLRLARPLQLTVAWSLLCVQHAKSDVRVRGHHEPTTLSQHSFALRQAAPSHESW